MALSPVALSSVALSAPAHALLKELIENNTHKSGGAARFRYGLAKLEPIHPVLKHSVAHICKPCKWPNKPLHAKNALSAILQNNECLVDPLVSLASAFDAANAELVMLDKIITILTSTKDNNRISSNLHLSYSSMSALPCYSNCSVIATKAPKGTLLDVPPNPDSGSGYQLYVKSSLGNVDVFLVTMSSGSVIDSSIEHEGDHAEYAGRLILWYK